MKKTLLGTTALVAAGMVAGPAMASDPISINIGGKFITGFFVMDTDEYSASECSKIESATGSRPSDCGSDGQSFGSTDVKIGEAEVEFSGETTLDNGLTVGVEVQLEATTTSDQIDESFVFLEGGFGQVRIGADDDAAYTMAYLSPWFVAGNGVDSPNFYNIQSTSVRTTTTHRLTNDANKIIYFTPRWAGFQLGASYAPDNDDRNGEQNGFGVRGDENTGRSEHIVSLGANYVNSFNGFDVAVSGGYTFGSAENEDNPDTDDPYEWSVGAEFGYAGFTLGGAYYENENIAVGSAFDIEGAEDDETEAWTAGLSYGQGPWTVGVAYFEAEGEVDAADVDPENSFLQFGGSYSLGSGISLGAEVQLIEDDTDVSGVDDIDSTSGGITLAVKF